MLNGNKIIDMKRIMIVAALLGFTCLLSAQIVNVDFSVDKGPVKPLNGVNGGMYMSFVMYKPDSENIVSYRKRGGRS